ncbi:hypothetical protein ACOMHN_053762 [Nucella lapillus]
MDKFEQPLKPPTVPNLPTHGSRSRTMNPTVQYPHPSFPSSRVPSKPTLRPSRKDLLKLENTLKKFLFPSPPSWETQKSETFQVKSFPQNFKELEPEREESKNIPTDYARDFVNAPLRVDAESGRYFGEDDADFRGNRNLGDVSTVRLNAGHGGSFGQEDRDFQGNRDLGFGPGARGKSRKEQMSEVELPKAETEEKLRPVSSPSFSMTFGSFIQDDMVSAWEVSGMTDRHKQSAVWESLDHYGTS